MPKITPLVGDERLRSGGFVIAERSRRGTFWKARGSTHLFTDEEAAEVVDTLIANEFTRSGHGQWLFEGDVYDTIQALDFVMRAIEICGRHE